MKGSRDDLARISKRIFNAEHRLRVASALLELDSGEFIDRGQLASRAPLPSTSAFNELEFLVEIGAARRVELNGRVAYNLTNSAYWQWCAEQIAHSRTHAPSDS